jgi:Uma2 family endonuclease
MVAQRVRQYVTVEEWRELNRTSADLTYEYVDGEVYAMCSGSRVHAWIAVNAVSILNGAFVAGPCLAYNSDIATRVSATRYNLPDVVVSCDSRDEPTRGESDVVAPHIVFEVLSGSTEARDRATNSTPIAPA